MVEGLDFVCMRINTDNFLGNSVFPMKGSNHFRESKAPPLTTHQARRLSELSQSLSQSQLHINSITDDTDDFILIKREGRGSVYGDALQHRIMDVEGSIRELEGMVISTESHPAEQGIECDGDSGKDVEAQLVILKHKHLCALDRLFPIQIVGAEQGITTFTIRGLYFTAIAPTNHAGVIGDDDDASLVEQANAAIGYTLLYLRARQQIDEAVMLPFAIYYEGSTSSVRLDGHCIPCHYTDASNDSLIRALRLISRTLMIGHNEAINTT